MNKENCEIVYKLLEIYSKSNIAVVSCEIIRISDNRVLQVHPVMTLDIGDTIRFPIEWVNRTPL